MNILDLAERDLYKARKALANAEKTPNIPEAQLEQTKKLLRLRIQIRNICANVVNTEDKK